MSAPSAGGGEDVADAVEGALSPASMKASASSVVTNRAVNHELQRLAAASRYGVHNNRD
jgi:hypothetical protein